jgi:hypothetical protein
MGIEISSALLLERYALIAKRFCPWKASSNFYRGK